MFTFRTGIILLITLLLVELNDVTAQGLSNELQWYSMEMAQEKAKSEQKDILIFAVAEWCVYCKKMDRNVFKEQEIIEAINKYFYPVRINIESDKPIRFNGDMITEAQFAEEYNLEVPPKTLFLTPDGNEMFSYIGFISEEGYSHILKLWSQSRPR